LGPDSSPWHTLPEIRSCKVDFGTPYLLAAPEKGVFSSITDFIAASITLLLHHFYFLSHFSTLTEAGADFDRGLPHFL